MKTQNAEVIADEAMDEGKMIDELAAFLGVEEPPKDEQVDSPAESADEATPEVEGDESVEETDAEVTEDNREEDAGEDEAERWMPESFDELAQALETTPQDLMAKLKLGVKVDGVESQATLEELQRNYQIASAANQRLEQAATMRKALEAEQQATVEKRKEMDTTLKAMEQLLAADYQRVDWEDLRANDPTEYMLKERELTQRYQTLMATKQQVEAKDKEEQEKMQAERQKMIDDHLKAQAEALVRTTPEWADAKVRNTEIGDVVNYMKQFGSTDEELSQVADHRVWTWARKAMLYDKLQTTANPKAKQMKQKPKFVPPGRRQAKTTARDNAKKASFERAMRVQTDDAWADALAAKLFSSDGD